MLVSMKEMLEDARKNHYALPAFDISNYDMMKTVLEACEEERSPALLMALAGGEFDDVFVYAPVPAVVELGDEILGFDGCLNFFAGLLDQKFSAKFNFYNVHYKQHHVSGTSLSTNSDFGGCASVNF